MLSHSDLSFVPLFVTPWTATRWAPMSMGIPQARILEWVVSLSSKRSAQPRNQTQVFALQADSLPSIPLSVRVSISQFSHSVMSYVLRPHGLQQARLHCPSPTPGAYLNPCPSRWWCHPTISSSFIPWTSCLQSFPASGSFPMRQFFSSGGQSIGVSASALVLPMNTQDWFPLG